MSIDEALAEYTRTKQAYLDAQETANRATLYELSQAHKAAQVVLSETIRGNAKDCPDCGNAPHGMLQEIAVRRSKVRGYGIGCLLCKDRYAEALSQDEAILNWNADAYGRIGN